MRDGEAVIGGLGLPEVERQSFDLPSDAIVASAKSLPQFRRQEFPPIGSVSPDGESSVFRYNERGEAIIDATGGVQEGDELREVPEGIKTQIVEVAKVFADTNIENSDIFAHASNFKVPGERKIFFDEIAKLKAIAIFRNNSGGGAMNNKLLLEQEKNIGDYLKKGYELWNEANRMRGEIRQTQLKDAS